MIGQLKKYYGKQTLVNFIRSFGQNIELLLFPLSEASNFGQPMPVVCKYSFRHAFPALVIAADTGLCA